VSNDVPNELQSNALKEFTLLPPVQFNK